MQTDSHSKPRVLGGWCAFSILCIHAALLAWGAFIHSPTLNEPGHLVAGLSHWELGKFNLYKVNPPLVRLIATAPVLATDAKTNWTRYVDAPAARSELELGEDFIETNCERSAWYFTLARWVVLPFSLLGGFICYRWARELYGQTGGLLALSLWCFSPNILAHGQLITTDVAGASLGVAASYLFWHWLERPDWWHTLFSGLLLGCALLAKTTLLILIPLWPITWLIVRWRADREKSMRVFLREAFMITCAMPLIAVYVINLGYLFEGSGTKLGQLPFLSQALAGDLSSRESQTGNRFSDSWLGEVPVPLPKNYVLGIDMQKRVFEIVDAYSYLRGEFSSQGWWYHYLYAMGVKIPLGTWILIVLSVSLRFYDRKRSNWGDDIVVLLPAMALLVFVSLQANSGGHLRYVLPVFPFLFVWTSRVGKFLGRQHRIVTGIVTASLIWSISNSLWFYPHSLSYFNELAGGPTGGQIHLIHSNLDWGQDFLLLKKWQQEHPEATPLHLAYFASYDPKHLGIEYVQPDLERNSRNREGEPTQIPPGWYAISVNFIRGFPYFTYRDSTDNHLFNRQALKSFQELEPADHIGYSIYIYQIEE